MSRIKVLALTIALAPGLASEAAVAQGVAPGGGIANTTGIGNGLGPPGGTGPHYPNATPQPTLPPPPPPGGYGAPLRPPAISIGKPPSYPQPTEPFGPPVSRTSAEVLRLPEAPAGSLAFLNGCWRSDVFQYGHQGVTTYCFDDKGGGRFLYRRLDQPAYFCRGSTQARYAGRVLRLRNSGTTCSDGDNRYPPELECAPGGDEPAQCSGRGETPAGPEAWTVRLHRTR